MRFSGSPFGALPPVVKNLLIINVLFYLACLALNHSFGIRLETYLGLHLPNAEHFRFYQLLSYLFLHAYPDIYHLFFNMFALFMFGRVLEDYWGSNRFLVYYIVCGVGAALLHLVIQYIEVLPTLRAMTYFLNNASHENLVHFMQNTFVVRSPVIYSKVIEFQQAYSELAVSNPDAALSLARQFVYDYRADYLNSFITIGASGSVFGLLLAFGMLFPDVRLMLLIPPIPIRAKYFVIIYGIITLFLGVANFSFDNVAHFAHLGGMLFGFIMIKYWRSKGVY